MYSHHHYVKQGNDQSRTETGQIPGIGIAFCNISSHRLVFKRNAKIAILFTKETRTVNKLPKDGEIQPDFVDILYINVNNTDDGKLKTGDIAPGFSFAGHDGIVRHLSDYLGRKVILYFILRTTRPDAPLKRAVCVMVMMTAQQGLR